MELDPGKIRERFHIFRKSIGYTQKQMAFEAGISRAFITHVETGKQKPSYEFLMKIVSKFNLSLDWLISGKGQMFIIDDENILNKLEEKHINHIKKLLNLNEKTQDRLLEAFNTILQDDEK